MYRIARLVFFSGLLALLVMAPLAAQDSPFPPAANPKR